MDTHLAQHCMIYLFVWMIIHEHAKKQTRSTPTSQRKAETRISNGKSTKNRRNNPTTHVGRKIQLKFSLQFFNCWKTLRSGTETCRAAVRTSARPRVTALPQQRDVTHLSIHRSHQLHYLCSVLSKHEL